MTKEDLKHDYSFSVLQEQVATEDLFEDKTHEKVAKTLNKLISNTEQGLTIGLEGGWGSGKSTVINLLKGELEKSNENTMFFAFDAWAHDGDPLRKIFLESLISSIDPEEKDKKLNRLRSEVSARKKTVVVKTEKSASKLGKFLSLSALTIPVGAALLTAVKYEKLLWPWQDMAARINFTFLFGILLSFSPLLALALWSKFGEKDAKTDKVKWDFFQSESEENYTQDVTEDGERTSIEFERFFNEILSYVFDSNSDYHYEQVIIVIDNLDRVEPEYAQNIWSTLQTFFQHRTSSLNNDNHQWKNKLWFLIPFDREGIKKIWQGDSALGSVVDADNEVAASFMEKCFQITVEVPPSVMSAWIDYLKQCVNKSFTGWPEKQRLEFIESYIRCMSKLVISPSPRQIHTHINRAGIIGLHWNGTFSAEAICIYSLCRQSITESQLRSALLDDGLPKAFPNTRDINDLKAELAGILFGVDAKKGIQLLLTPQIKTALSDGDGEKLKELAETHKAAFWLAFRSCSHEWMVTDAHTDKYKINTVTAMHEAFETSNSYLAPFIEQIKNVFLLSFDNWKLSEYSYQKPVESLIQLVKYKEAFLRALKSKLQNKIKTVVNNVDNDTFASKELKALGELETLVRKWEHPLTRHYYPKLDFGNWQAWLEQCKSEDVEFESVLPRKETFTDLVGNSHLNQATPNKVTFDVLITTYKKYSSKDVWTNLTSSLITWFNIPNRAVEAESQYSLAISLFSSASEEDVEALKKCVQGAAFWKRAVSSPLATNASLPFLVAIAAPEFRDNQFVSGPVKKFLSEKLSEEQIINGFQLFKSANDLLAIWTLAKEGENLFARQMLNMIEDKTLFLEGARYVDDIQWENETETLNAVEKLCKSGAMKEIESEIRDEPQLYNRTIYLLQNYGDTNANNFVVNLLDGLNREDWLNAFKDNNELLKCVPEKSYTFGKAWADYFKLIVSGELEKIELSVFKFQFGLKEKVLDLKDVHLPAIAAKYFEDRNEDHLSDEEFNEISSSVLPMMKGVAQKDYEMRLTIWIEKNYTSRIDWFLNAELSYTCTALESIVAAVTSKLKTSKGEELALYKQLNEKLKLGLDWDKLIGDVNLETEAKVNE
jgi:hypothetical protein